MIELGLNSNRLDLTHLAIARLDLTHLAIAVRRITNQFLPTAVGNLAVYWINSLLLLVIDIILLQGSILVDEYAHISGCVAGLLEMLRAFLPPTFSLLNITHNSGNNNQLFLTSLKNHPDTVDDFFRLNARFLQRASLPYLQTDFVPSVIECALMAINLDHKDANGSVMKFIFDLFHLGRSKEERDDFEHRSAIVYRYVAQWINWLFSVHEKIGIAVPWNEA